MKIKIRLPSMSLDWLLVATIAGLLVVLCWPAVEAWENRPRPGVQVCQQYVGQGGSSPNAAIAHVDYLLYLPPEYDGSRKWPLVVFLHGSGARGQDLQLVRREGLPRQIDGGKQLPFILVSPQCPADSNWNPEQIVKLIDDASNRFSVDADRVYLIGFSMGGFGTWETACYAPGRFAAIVPVAGGGDVAQAQRLVNLPIWAFHGGDDDTVPLEANKTMVDAVRKCGGHVEFTVYPNCGHDICNMLFYDGHLYEWLLAQRRSQHPSRGVEGKEKHGK